MDADLPVIVSFGGGTNSTAMLCGFREREIVPSAIFFADTGGEMAYTYDHVAEMDAKCIEWWGIGIEIVRKLYKGRPETLEEQCLRTKQLPSLAYGHKQCSVHFKGRPQDQAQKRWMVSHGALSQNMIGLSWQKASQFTQSTIWWNGTGDAQIATRQYFAMGCLSPGNRLVSFAPQRTAIACLH